MEDFRAASEYDQDDWNFGEVSLTLDDWSNLDILLFLSGYEAG